MAEERALRAALAILIELMLFRSVCVADNGSRSPQLSSCELNLKLRQIPRQTCTVLTKEETLPIRTVSVNFTSTSFGSLSIKIASIVPWWWDQLLALSTSSCWWSLCREHHLSWCAVSSSTLRRGVIKMELKHLHHLACSGRGR